MKTKKFPTAEPNPFQRFNIPVRHSCSDGGSTFLPRRSDLPRHSEATAGAKTGQRAFTLIEVLVVIAIAVVIAALLLTVGGTVVQKSNLNRAMAERDQLVAAIGVYHDKYGYYPPDNTAPNGTALTNQLYYELLGTTTNLAGTIVNFTTLDGGSQITAPTVQGLFGIGAIMNSSKGSGDDAISAKTFLANLNASEVASNGVFTFIVTGANSDSVYKPMPGVYSLAGRNANPWRYVCPGTNNPKSYDLWVQVFVGNKSNLICNWSREPLANVPLN